jgi:hypothetical protein
VALPSAATPPQSQSSAAFSPPGFGRIIAYKEPENSALKSGSFPAKSHPGADVSRCLQMSLDLSGCLSRWRTHLRRITGCTRSLSPTANPSRFGAQAFFWRPTNGGWPVVCIHLSQQPSGGVYLSQQPSGGVYLSQQPSGGVYISRCLAAGVHMYLSQQVMCIYLSGRTVRCIYLCGRPVNCIYLCGRPEGCIYLGSRPAAFVYFYTTYSRAKQPGAGWGED